MSGALSMMPMRYVLLDEHDAHDLKGHEDDRGDQPAPGEQAGPGRVRVGVGCDHRTSSRQT